MLYILSYLCLYSKYFFSKLKTAWGKAGISATLYPRPVVLGLPDENLGFAAFLLLTNSPRSLPASAGNEPLAGEDPQVDPVVALKIAALYIWGKDIEPEEKFLLPVDSNSSYRLFGCGRTVPSLPHFELHEIVGWVVNKLVVESSHRCHHFTGVFSEYASEANFGCATRRKGLFHLVSGLDRDWSFKLRPWRGRLGLRIGWRNNTNQKDCGKQCNDLANHFNSVLVGGRCVLLILKAKKYSNIFVMFWQCFLLKIIAFISCKNVKNPGGR
jgi:hypothetical protein